MATFNFQEFHAPRDANLFLLSMGAMVCFFMATATWLVSWLGGGELYVEQFGGTTALVVLIVGFVTFAICAALTEPRE